MADRPLVRFEQGLDELLDVDWVALSGVELLDALRGLERHRNRVAAVDVALIAEIHARGLAADHGLRDTATLVSRTIRVHPGRARARVRAATYVAGRRRLTGEPTEPVLPVAAEALRAGEVSPEHLDVLIDTVEAVPPDIRCPQPDGGAELRSIVERTLTNTPATSTRDSWRGLPPRSRRDSTRTACSSPNGSLTIAGA